MAYLGNNTDHNAEVFTTTKDRFSGNASTTAFTLSAVPANAESMQVYVNNVRQDSGRAYTVSGTTLTFTEAPSSATGNIYVVFNSVIAGIHQVITANTQLRTDVVTPHAISNTSTYSVGELLVAGQITVSGGDTAAGDNAALGYTAAEGLILTGQGSTSDITIKNDADADVITIATGGTNVDIVGDITAATVNADGDTSAGDNAAIGYTAAEGLILTGQGSTSDITLKNDADGTVCYVPTGLDDLRFPDNAKLELGTGADLQIYHDASDSYIAEGGTGALKIRASDLRLENANGSETYAILAGDGAVTLYYDNSAKLATASGGATLTGQLDLSSHLDMPDNAYIKLGTGDDLQIFHNATNSAILNTTGDLYIGSSTALYLCNATGSEIYFKGTENAETRMYYDNATKIETKTGGAGITGQLDLSSHLDMPDSAQINLGTSDDLQLYHNGSHSYIVENGTGQLYLATNYLSITNAGITETMATFDDDGAVSLYYDNSVKLQTGSGGVTIPSSEVIMTDGRNIQWGGANCRIQGTNNGSFQLFTGATERLTVHNDGRILVHSRIATPFYGAMAARNSNQTISNDTWTTVTWDAEVHDTDSMFSTSTNPTRITVPTGVTQIRVSSFIYYQWHASKAQGVHRHVQRIKKNGSFHAYGFSIYADFAAANYNLMAGSYWPVLFVTAGDYIELEVFHNTGYDAYVAGSGSSNSYDASRLVVEILKDSD